MFGSQRAGLPPPSSKPKQKPEHKKLARLPQNAKIQKRPLLRPAIPSPHAGSSQQKIVYISSHTPFLSAVKRVEKLLHLADKRFVQSATTNAKHSDRSHGKRKRGADGDEILGIAQEVEKMKRKKRGKTNEAVDGCHEDGPGEEVVLKGTGKAIHRVLELALWFQQREDDYVVRLKTGSVGAIDDISIEEAELGSGEGVEAQVGTEENTAMDVDPKDGQQARENDRTTQHPEASKDMEGKKKAKRKRKREKTVLARDEVPETRVRYTSVLEAAVSLW